MKGATAFKGFEALHNIALDINDRLLCFDVQTEVGQMYKCGKYPKTFDGILSVPLTQLRI